jgi:fumarate hydratase subunit beta
VIGSAGPTTSARMDRFSPILLAAGLKGMIGKGYRNDAVRDALKKYCAVHFAAVGGAGALLSQYIVSAEVAAYEDLGAEAIRKLELKEFPAIVAYDSYGGNVFKRAGE